jgi:hypothetical protein
MCSIPDARIVLIGQAIDELAQETRTGAAGSSAADGGTDDVAQRLAQIWAMIAELDPGLAARLPRYTGPAD